MSLGARPVASLYKRAVYKTEFDIFKQNTDIDLISLVSLEDDPKEQDFISRRCRSSRVTENRSRPADTLKKDSYKRCVSARFPGDVGRHETTRGLANGRTCKSAVSRNDKTNYSRRNRCQRQSARGIRGSEPIYLSNLNKRCRITVDFKYDKYTPHLNGTQYKSETKQNQVRPTHANRPRSEYTLERACNGSRNQPTTDTVRKRIKSAGSEIRPKSVTRRKSCRVGFVDSEKVCRSDKVSGDSKEERNDGGGDAALNEKLHDKVEENSDAKCDRHVDVIESEDSGVVKDSCLSVKDDVYVEEYKDLDETKGEEKVSDRISVCSVDGSDLSDKSDQENHVYDHSIGVHDLIKDLVDKEGAAECNETEVTKSRSDCDSIFSLYEGDGELGVNVEETIKATEEETAKPVQEPQDITMSKEAKRVIIETLHDLRDTKNKDNKENYGDNIRYKSVAKQKRMKENRSKYDTFMRERTETLLHLKVRNKEEKGSEYEKDNTSYESDFEEFSDTGKIKCQKLFPSISESNKRGSQTASSASSKQIYSLDQVKRRKYKIPGIGNYDLIASPVNDFEITPPGFDCRYDGRPILTKEELDPPPKCIQERSIQKCKKWLKNVNLSPLSLNPVLNKR